MSLKRLMVCFVALCAFLALHTPAWAAAVQTHPAPVAAEQLEFSPAQVAALQDMVAQSSGKPLIKVESWTWLFSIIPGLGQVLMGDMMRGILFFLGAAILPVAFGIVVSILAAVLGPIAGTLAIIGPIIGLAFWLWNLFDAYSMNQALLGKSADIQLTPSLRARREDGAVALRLQTATF